MMQARVLPASSLFEQPVSAIAIAAQRAKKPEAHVLASSFLTQNLHHVGRLEIVQHLKQHLQVQVSKQIFKMHKVIQLSTQQLLNK